MTAENKVSKLLIKSDLRKTSPILGNLNMT